MEGQLHFPQQQRERAMSSAVRIFVPRNLIPLQQAVLCANCEVVSDSKNGHCVVCGSPSLLNLARVLDGSNRTAERGWTRSRKIRAVSAAPVAVTAGRAEMDEHKRIG